MNIKISFLLIISFSVFLGCSDNNGSANNSEDCEDSIGVDTTRGVCNVSLSYENRVSFSESGDFINITSDNIPNHDVGLFGNISGALNPNAIAVQNSSYQIDLTPEKSATPTPLQNNGPQYAFGILFNGIELDPVAAEPWPHQGGPGPPQGGNVNWDWNLEASMVQIGLDCNNAHVQPTGKYHYHGVPTLYLESLKHDSESMLHLGYAADGFPIYYKYGYSTPDDPQSELIELEPSYRLKSGERDGDGDNLPCGKYSGIYTADYEFVDGLGHLDACNGRDGITPEFPKGTYYYVITETYPGIPRCFVGLPSADFKLGAP